MTAKATVYVSILNWNAANATLRCVDSVLSSQVPTDIDVRVIIIDNASDTADFEILKSGIKDVRVHIYRNESNHGFAGGHNPVITDAIAKEVDYIWLLNNDTTIEANTLAGLIAHAIGDSKLGAVSPVLVAAHDENLIDFCGGIHDWNALNAIKLTKKEEGLRLEKDDQASTWLSGAALLLRVAAVKQVGLLDEDMFAYYEDNDMSCKLLNSGWKNKVAFDCKVLHATSTDVYRQRPPYYFYLMARNSFLFWHRHTPKLNRRLLTLRLFDREMLIANRLGHQGLINKKSACMLGIFDGIFMRKGAPNLNRPIVSHLMNLVAILFSFGHKKFY